MESAWAWLFGVLSKLWALLAHWLPGIAAVGYSAHVDKKKLGGISSLLFMLSVGAMCMAIGSLAMAKFAAIPNPISHPDTPFVDLIYFYMIELAIGLFGMAIINQLQSSLPAQVPLWLDEGRQLFFRIFGGGK